jgi:hypothetical protein
VTWSSVALAGLDFRAVPPMANDKTVDGDFPSLIRLIPALSADRFGLLLEAVDDRHLTVPNLIDAVCRVLEDESAAEQLVRFLISLEVQSHRIGFDSEHLVKSLLDGEGIEDEDLALTRFEQLLRCQNLVKLSKATDLSSEHDRYFDTARLICDIRPVFGDDKDSVDSVLLSHDLRITYIATSGVVETTSIRMDTEDLKFLRDLVDDEIRKTVSVRKFLKQGGAKEMFSKDEMEAHK